MTKYEISMFFCDYILTYYDNSFLIRLEDVYGAHYPNYHLTMKKSDMLKEYNKIRDKKIIKWSEGERRKIV